MPKLPMVIGVLEYGEVRLYESMDQVMREWGPYPADVASQVIVFYDTDGVWLELGLHESSSAPWASRRYQGVYIASKHDS